MQSKSSYHCAGEPAEATLRVLAENLGPLDDTVLPTLSSLSPMERVHAVCSHHENRINRHLTFEFSRNRKMMSVPVSCDSKLSFFLPREHLSLSSTGATMPSLMGRLPRYRTRYGKLSLRKQRSTGRTGYGRSGLRLLSRTKPTLMLPAINPKALATTHASSRA